MSETNTLSDALVTTFWSLLASIHTCMPGRIESYEFKTQKASVKPLLKKKFLDGDVIEIPPLVNVPVVFPRTSTAGVTFPLKKGDGVLLVFAERSLERWYSSGLDSEPGDSRKFDLSDAIAIPGLFSFAQANLARNNTDLVVENEGQKITIKPNGEIELGGANLKKLVNEEFKAVFDGHVHNVSVAGTAAAQAGVTSSPVAAAGTDPIVTPAVPVTLFAIGKAMPSDNLTSQVKAQ